MLEEPSEIDPLIRQVMADYENSQAFFAEHRLPEYVVLEDLELHGRERALFLTLTCVTNHIHDGSGASKKTDGPNGLWQICADLWDQHRWMFLPEELVGNSRTAELAEIFSGLEIMDERDPDWWFRNSRTLHSKWDDDPRELLANPSTTLGDVNDASYDAPSIERAVSANDFPALGGSKILPLWLRLMHDEVHSLKPTFCSALPRFARSLGKMLIKSAPPSPRLAASPLAYSRREAPRSPGRSSARSLISFARGECTLFRLY